MDKENCIFVEKKLRYHTTKKNMEKMSPHITYGSIDELNNKKLDNFKKSKQYATKYEKKLNKLRKDLNVIESKTTFDENDISLRAKLKDDIEEVEEKLNNIYTCEDEADYFFQNNTIDVLTKYYDTENSTTQSKSDSTNDDDFNSDRVESFNKMKDFMNHIKQEENEHYNISILHDYVSRTMDKTLIKKKKQDRCHHCRKKDTLNIADGRLVCINCGYCDIEIKDMEKTNFKDSFYENKSTGYQRMNHFSELLNQFQAKESTDIKPEVYSAIVCEIKKMGLNDPTLLTNPILRKILKKLDYNNYFEHIPYIINKLTGITPPTIPHEIEMKLKKMFKDIQGPFEKYKPNEKKNFLNYNFVFYKFFELLGMDDFLQYFSLLKSPEKIKEHDDLWCKICAELKWEYIPSH